MPQFKINEKTSVFHGPDGKDHYPGDVVDLPKNYAGYDFVEPVNKPKWSPPPRITSAVKESKEKAPPTEDVPNENLEDIQ
jgi:hypothetical protein